MECIFLNFYKNGKFPIANIGPSKVGMIFMVLLASLIISYFIFIIQFYTLPILLLRFFHYLLVIINVLAFCFTILKDPGVKESVYNHYIKM